jgi:asparagine synthase (glutamine-hydrolysing)
MCGICGIVFDDADKKVSEDVLCAMNRTMVHRGPDDEGYFIGRGVGIAMRRLSIIDVEAGHQPIFSEDENVAAVCNGEIYNFKDLRRELESEGHVFKTRTDVEVLPHLYEREGVGFVDKLAGMFGLAVWDCKNRTLILARDRMGKKPLYWMKLKGAFIFGSEPKALLKNPLVSPALDRRAAAKYLAYEYVPAPDTIYEGIKKLEPGFALVLKDGEVRSRRYWDVPAGDEVENISEDVAIQHIRSLLMKAVDKRLVSDVPLGVFLSGGIDSSSVVAMMSKLREPSEIKTFSIAFSEKSFDESSYARAVAAHFGTDHREEVLSPNDLLDLLPEITSFLDEPLGDASIIPTYALSKFTRQHVTVALGGDGGDELFAGYPTFLADAYAKKYLKLPAALRRRVIEPVARRLPVSDDNISFDFKVKQFLKGVYEEDHIRHALWMGSFSQSELRAALAYDMPPDIFQDAMRHYSAARRASRGNRVLYMYEKLYLAEDILTKVDRASMWASLEARAPFLDHELVEFVSRLPYRLKLGHGKMKYILKKAMGPLLPKGIAGRSKKGFGIPVAKWIKGPMKEFVLDLLAEDKIKREGILNYKTVSRLISDHLEGKVDNRKKLWTLLAFEGWLDKWLM